MYLQVWFSCPMRVEEAIHDSYVRCAGSWAWTSRPRRSRTRRRCCTSAICWRSMTWAPGCWPSRVRSSPSRVDHAGGSIVDATIIAAPSRRRTRPGPGPGDAPRKGKPVVLRDEGPHRCRRGDRANALGDRDSSERARPWTRSPTWSGPDDEVVTPTPATKGVEKRPDVATSGDPSGIEWRIAARRGVAGHARAGPGHRLCPGRCARQVEHRS